METCHLTIFLLLISVILGKEQPWLPSSLDENWIELHEDFVTNSRVSGKNITVLFIGDSITRRWQTDGLYLYNEHYVPLGAANYGVGGDSTQHVLWRVINGEVDGIEPRVCILKIGTNNINEFTDLEIARGITAIVNELRTRLPSTKILLVGVLPRNDAATSKITENINKNVASLDNGYSIRFLNMVDHYYEGNGNFYAELFLDDLLHLSPKGYEKWHEIMWPLFVEMYNAAEQPSVPYLTMMLCSLLIIVYLSMIN